MSPEENAFFESGGETAIPDDAGSSEGSQGAGVDGAQASEGQKAPKSEKGDGDSIPLSKFMEEKNRRRDLDKQNRELSQKVAELTGKFSIIERLKLGGETEAPKGPPSPEEDIFGNVKHVGETVAQLQKRLDDADAATKATAEQTTFVNNYRADAAKFEATKPDFKAAYDFILNSRAAELKAIGYDTPQALHEALVADELAIAQMAFAKGKSPAEMLYTLATQRGYKAAAAADSKAADTGKGAEKLATIERGQQANKSLSNTGGSSGDAEMTAERLISMPMDEFEAWCDKNPAKAKRILGG